MSGVRGPAFTYAVTALGVVAFLLALAADAGAPTTSPRTAATTTDMTKGD